MYSIFEKYTKAELIIIIITCIILIFILKNFQLQISDTNIIISLLGTFIGFNVTTISIISTNKYSKELYKIQVSNKKYTQLDVLINYVRTAITLSFIIIVLILFCNSTVLTNKEIYYMEIFCLSVLCIVFNFISFRYLFAFSRKCILCIRND